MKTKIEQIDNRALQSVIASLWHELQKVMANQQKEHHALSIGVLENGDVEIQARWWDPKAGETRHYGQVWRRELADKQTAGVLGRTLASRLPVSGVTYPEFSQVKPEVIA